MYRHNKNFVTSSQVFIPHTKLLRIWLIMGSTYQWLRLSYWNFTNSKWPKYGMACHHRRWWKYTDNR